SRQWHREKRKTPSRPPPSAMGEEEEKTFRARAFFGWPAAWRNRAGYYPHTSPAPAVGAAVGPAPPGCAGGCPAPTPGAHGGVVKALSIASTSLTTRLLGDEVYDALDAAHPPSTPVR